MADKELRVHLKADDDITPVAKKAAAELKKLEKPIEVDADVSGVLAAFDQVAAEARATAAAAERLGQALGPELAAKADPGAIVGDLKQMGLSLEQITANADQLGAKMRELSDADVGGKMGASLGTTRGQMDELRNSSDQTKSVMANLTGNAAQDMGQLAGVTGTAGVALGQLAEYATEGNISLGSLVKLAGPMLGVALAAEGITKHFAAMAKIEAFENEQVDAYAESIREGADATQSLVDRLKEAAEIEVLDLLGDVTDLTPKLQAAGLSVEQWAKLVTGSREELDAWAVASVEAGGDVDVLKDVTLAAQREQKLYAEGQRQAAIQTEVFGEETVTATDATKDFHRELAKTEAEQAAQRRVDRIRAMADATIAAREAMKAYNEATAGIDFGNAALQGAVTGMSAWSDRFFAIPETLAAGEAAFDSFTESVKEHGLTLDLNTEAGRANQEALIGVARTLEDDFAAAYAESGGDMDTFKRKSDVIATQTLNRLQSELGLSAEEVEALRVELGLTEGEYEARFLLSGQEEAMAKLGLLQGAIEGLDKDTEVRVNQKIIMGDYVGALALVNGYYANNPARLPVQPYLTGINPKYNPGLGVIGGGPRSVTPTATATATTAAPAGYAAPVYTVRIPAPSPSITINAGVVGNRFDVDRTVTKALRRHRRLNGERE